MKQVFCRNTRAPNDNFWKISVRKTISDLELSEHLLLNFLLAHLSKDFRTSPPQKKMISLPIFNEFYPKKVTCTFVSYLLPKCAGQKYVTWHALHNCTESWFACGSSTAVLLYCGGGKCSCYSYKFKFFIHFLLEVFPRNLLRSSMDS